MARIRATLNRVLLLVVVFVVIISLTQISSQLSSLATSTVATDALGTVAQPSFGTLATQTLLPSLTTPPPPPLPRPPSTPPPSLAPAVPRSSFGAHSHGVVITISPRALQSAPTRSAAAAKVCAIAHAVQRWSRPTTTPIPVLLFVPSTSPAAALTTDECAATPTPLFPDSLVAFAALPTSNDAGSSYGNVGELGLLLESLERSPFEHTVWVNGSRPLASISCAPFTLGGTADDDKVGVSRRSDPTSTSGSATVGAASGTNPPAAASGNERGGGASGNERGGGAPSSGFETIPPFGRLEFNASALRHARSATLGTNLLRRGDGTSWELY